MELHAGKLFYAANAERCAAKTKASSKFMPCRGATYRDDCPARVERR